MYYYLVAESTLPWKWLLFAPAFGGKRYNVVTNYWRVEVWAD